MFWQSGETPLHVTSSQGNVGAIQLLLQKGANVNETDEVSNITPYTQLSVLRYLTYC